MADEDKTMMEVGEPEDGAKAGGPSMIKKYGILGGIVVVMIVAAWFVTAKIVKPMLAGGGETAQVEEGASEASSHGGDSASKEAKAEESSHGSAKESGGGHGGEGASSAGADNMILIDNIVVNPAGTGGTRFLATSIGFELETGSAAGLFKDKEIIVRDALITILSSQSIPELSDFKQRERLRKLIKLRVEKLLKTEDVSNVYFTEFVLQ